MLKHKKKKRRQYKIGTVNEKLRCKLCNKEILKSLDKMHEHVLQSHSESELIDFGITQEELEVFQTWKIRWTDSQ